MLGEALGLSHSDLTALYRGGYLHDLGKISIPDAILFKQGLSQRRSGE
jgi:putative two-component system response regulator